MSELSTKSRRKPLDEGCVGGIFCPVEGHVISVRNGSKWSIKHVPLSKGQERTLFERAMARAKARQDWITDRFGYIGTGGQRYADGTHWTEAERAWKEHLKEQGHEL